MGGADEKRLSRAVQDITTDGGVLGVSSRDGTIYIRPADSVTREKLKRRYTSGHNGFPVVVEQAARRAIPRRRGILRVKAEVREI